MTNIRLDNTTAVAYINKMGGTKSGKLIQLVKDIWEWCKIREIVLTAEHLPGKSNQIADWESRNISDSSDWKLDTRIFKQIIKIFGPCDIDLFASRLNCQILKFVSWRPDPDAIGTDAFLIPWSGFVGYAFPPFCLVGKTLSKIAKERGTVIMIAPIWQAQPWYPMLLQMSIQDPIRLPCFQSLLTS